jgi:hypothetical protein
MTSLCTRRAKHIAGRLAAARAALITAVALAGCILASLAAPAEAAPAPSAPATAPRLTFGVQPALRSALDSTRADFSYSATPGARINDYIAIRNYALAPVTLQTYAGDAFNGPTGAFDVLRRGQKSKDLGAWISLTRASVTIPGRSYVIVPFRIQLPANALPGDHDAGIVAAIITQQLRSNHSRVSVEERVGARVRIRVSGPLKPELSVRQLKTVFTGSLSPLASGRAKVTYEIVNTGNVVLSTTQRVEVHAMIGGTKQAPSLAAISNLLPGNSARVSVTVRGVAPGIRVKATVVLDPKGSSTEPVSGLVEVRRSSSTWAVPWMLLGVIVLILLAFAAFRWWLRRRSRKRAMQIPERPRELVGAGVTSAPAPQAVPVPIDLRDAPPLEVDVTDPADNGVIDLRRRDAPEAEPPDGGFPPPANPTRK